LFRDAVKSNAAALILAHNHPSGDSTPSKEDIDATLRFMEMGKMMGVRIIDHIVIAQGGSVSMRQLGSDLIRTPICAIMVQKFAPHNTKFEDTGCPETAATRFTSLSL